MGIIISVIRYFTCGPVEESRKNKHDECSLEEIYIEEPKLIENVGDREDEVIKIVVTEERWIFHSLLVWPRLFVQLLTYMIATSLDSREFLTKNYRKAICNIEHLKNRGCRVMHGVDVTEMANNPLLKGVKFDRIIYIFPHAGFFRKELRESQISKHQQLVSLFLKNAKEMNDETGEIHITHKTNGFTREWNLELLASRQGLRLLGVMRFNYTDYPSVASATTIISTAIPTKLTSLHFRSAR